MKVRELPPLPRVPESRQAPLMPWPIRGLVAAPVLFLLGGLGINVLALMGLTTGDATTVTLFVVALTVLAALIGTVLAWIAVGLTRIRVLVVGAATAAALVLIVSGFVAAQA